MASVQPQTFSTSLLGDRYEVLAPLGAGASANVFRVRDLRTGAVRAAKVLKTGNDRIGSSFSNASRAETLSRFEDEFRILRTLHHPHLPEVFDYGRTEDGVCFLIMELVDGEPLDAYFRAHPSDIWVMLYELCETLVFVHARNLLHQDIKPSNILVSRVAVADGERPVIKLIDFGLTYRRGVGAAVRLVGTAEYIAPEVARGERSLTRAVDYYSLGATLFELLTGAPPFVGSENQVLRAHLEREPVIENEELEWAELYPHVRALLSKDSQKRLAAFEEFRRVVVGRLTGGIDDLDRSYALARIDSLGMVGKKEAWGSLLKWLDVVAATAPNPEKHTLSISGVEGVGKRFLTSSLRAEASLRGVRTLAPSEIGWTERDDAAARQPALMWSRLLEACEKEPIILVVDRPMSLPDEERSFVRLAGTQWELYRSRGRVLPLFFLMAVDSTSEDAETLDYLPSDGAIKLELPALSRTDCEQIVEQFRGAMFDPRDARALTTYLERFDNSGAAIQGLQRAVLRGGLTFLGQRWKVQPGLLTEIVESRRDDSFARELVASLWPFERRVATLVAAHPDPVPVAWVAAFADVDSSAVLSIVAGPAKRLLTASAGNVAPASGAVRDALRAGCDPVEMRQAHEFLAEKSTGLDRTVSVDRALAHHLEQLGRVRD
ncbi:MAG TPA: serine/threonine-protein kinase, partial [Candidatus Krumholzibacteria bacterium]|nr:serine/threonine-protein kinase [Candidatus Krumholzibacteria bacterium]